MADMLIDISSIYDKKDTLSSLSTKASNIHSSYSNSAIAKAPSPISGLSTIVEKPLKRYDDGLKRANEWLSNYLSGAESIESNLKSQKGSKVKKTTTFSGKFEDLYSKVTMPVLKTNGDTTANYKTYGSGGTAAEATTEATTEVTAGKVTGNTNKDKVYNYLSSQGFNNAAICGILSNIQYESNFNPTATGDKGTSYGICQWHNSRWTNLKNYCSKNGLNSSSLEGQLSYLVYELKKNYPKVYNKLKSVPNTAQGAYDASYYWTVHFEVPANKYTQGDKRGKSAQTTYWNTYGNVTST